jgi:hypothetical protein
VDDNELDSPADDSRAGTRFEAIEYWMAASVFALSIIVLFWIYLPLLVFGAKPD